MTRFFQPLVTPSHHALAKILRLDPSKPITASNEVFSLEQLCATHRHLFAGTEHDFHAGRLRTLSVHAGSQSFPLAREVKHLMTQTFLIGLPHPLCVVDWVVYVLSSIHPFLDGNRRTCWMFANNYLAEQGFYPIDWDGFRPCWEQVVLLAHEQKMELMWPKL
ncbi:MAG TPA: Fic family protein, partial [Agitococcus sp.]|nr:Fic family protein [Agitococcus sp.]